MFVPHNIMKILFFWFSQPILIAKFALAAVQMTLGPVIFVKYFTKTLIKSPQLQLKHRSLDFFSFLASLDMQEKQLRVRKPIGK